MSIELTIVTPEGQAFDDQVDQVVLPGAEGDFGVLQHHERYLAPLKPGPVEIQQGGRSHWAAVSDGFADVSGEQVVVLVDRCTIAEEIDAGRVEQEKSQAESELKDLSGSANDELRRQALEVEIREAEVWLEVASRRTRP